MLPSSNLSQLIAALDGDVDQRSAAQALLFQMGGAVVEPLIAVMLAGEGHKAWAAAEVLGDLGDPRALPALVNMLPSPHPLIGGAALKAVLKFGGPDVVGHLVEALPRAHIIVQQSMILALQRLGDSRALPMLLEQIERAESPTIRVAIIQTLGKLGDARAVPVLRGYLNDSNHHVREWSADALEKLGFPPESDG